jgi:hypothetical protein
MNINACPIFSDLNEATEQAHSLARVMRRLRKRMLRCPKCEHYAECPVMEQFHQAIDIALQEFTQEWDLKV